MNRREVIRGLASLPIAGSIIGKPLNVNGMYNNTELLDLWQKEAKDAFMSFGLQHSPTRENGILADTAFKIPSVLYEGIGNDKSGFNFSSQDNFEIFRGLGVEPLINCMGTFTIIGGSLERPAVREAMEKGAHAFVQYDELAEGIGKRLAELTGAEWGMVSSGCAACMKQATLACVAGGNPEKLIRIPYLTGIDKTEVIIPRHSRNTYDHAIRNVGVTIINVDSPEELEQAINKRTAMIYITTGRASATGQPLSLENIVRIAKPHQVPVLVDAAAEDLTIPIVHLQRGADLVTYSGGKAFCGPQCSGLLFGRKDLVQAAWYSAAPHHGPGRDNKVGREEMLGALAAVEAWIKFDHKGQWNKWLSYLDTVSKSVSRVEGIKTEVRNPSDLNNNSPALLISWDTNKLNISGEEVAEEVGRNKPRIALSYRDNNENQLSQIQITSGQMQPGEDKTVAERLFGLLSKKRAARPGLKPAGGNLSGRWKVVIEYYGSQGNYTWFIEQKGNWLQGVNRGDLSSSDLAGMIDGDDLKIRCRPGGVGDSQISFTFTGRLVNDTITGSVYLVEYGTAKFKAERMGGEFKKDKITVPGGPPLAT